MRNGINDPIPEALLLLRATAILPVLPDDVHSEQDNDGKNDTHDNPVNHLLKITHRSVNES